MCGVAGFIPAQSMAPATLENLVLRMTSDLRHRGPDGQGSWVDPTGAVALGHRRLAIVDLSPTGAQPMLSAGGRYVIAFNGEIYNHRSLRAELGTLGAVFSGTSDTEVLLAGIEIWGLSETLARCTGMFAIALWDRLERRLQIARDRLGEKPLYVWRNSRGLAFASELTPLLEANNRDFSLDPTALALYLSYGYTPDRHCVVAGAYKLAPGTIETWALRPSGLVTEPEVLTYWCLDSSRYELPGSRQEVAQTLEAELSRAIGDQMIADVPVGAFLSGGWDSTAVTALTQALSSRPVRTFCVGFDDPRYDETPYARAIAGHLGTDHTELRISRRDLLEIVLDLPVIYDEPFADSSQIPAVAICREARRHVTVCLSGDGGDELFGGYNRYYWPGRLSRALAPWPRAMRRALGAALRGAERILPPAAISAAAAAVLPGRGPVQDAAGKLRKAAATLESDDPVALYLQLIHARSDARQLVPGWNGCDPGAARLKELMHGCAAFEAMTLWDIEHYLPGDNLTKVDRASMSVALEMRAPLLDHQVVGLARAIMKDFGEEPYRREPKWPLKDIVLARVPSKLMQRPKMGFSVPVGQWLRADLRDWVFDLVASPAAVLEGWLDLSTLKQELDDHDLGRRDASRSLWPVLALLAWGRHQLTKPDRSARVAA